MKKLKRTIAVAAVIIATNLSTFAAPPASVIQKVKSQVETMSYYLPSEAGYGLTLTQVRYDSSTYSIVYKYQYYLPVNTPTKAAIAEVKQGMIHMLKANPNAEDMQFIKSGITFHYRYYSSDGEFLYSIKITPSDVR